MSESHDNEVKIMGRWAMNSISIDDAPSLEGWL